MAEPSSTCPVLRDTERKGGRKPYMQLDSVALVAQTAAVSKSPTTRHSPNKSSSNVKFVHPKTMLFTVKAKASAARSPARLPLRPAARLSNAHAPVDDDILSYTPSQSQHAHASATASASTPAAPQQRTAGTDQSTIAAADEAQQSAAIGTTVSTKRPLEGEPSSPPKRIKLEHDAEPQSTTATTTIVEGTLVAQGTTTTTESSAILLEQQAQSLVAVKIQPQSQFNNSSAVETETTTTTTTTIEQFAGSTESTVAVDLEQHQPLPAGAAEDHTDEQAHHERHSDDDDDDDDDRHEEEHQEDGRHRAEEAEDDEDECTHSYDRGEQSAAPSHGSASQYGEFYSHHTEAYMIVEPTPPNHLAAPNNATIAAVLHPPRPKILEPPPCRALHLLKPEALAMFHSQEPSASAALVRPARGYGGEEHGGSMEVQETPASPPDDNDDDDGDGDGYHTPVQPNAPSIDRVRRALFRDSTMPAATAHPPPHHQQHPYGAYQVPHTAYEQPPFAQYPQQHFYHAPPHLHQQPPFFYHHPLPPPPAHYHQQHQYQQPYQHPHDYQHIDPYQYLLQQPEQQQQQQPRWNVESLVSESSQHCALSQMLAAQPDFLSDGAGSPSLTPLLAHLMAAPSESLGAVPATDHAATRAANNNTAALRSTQAVLDTYIRRSSTGISCSTAASKSDDVSSTPGEGHPIASIDSHHSDDTITLDSTSPADSMSASMGGVHEALTDMQERLHEGEASRRKLEQLIQSLQRKLVSIRRTSPEATQDPTTIGGGEVEAEAEAEADLAHLLASHHQAELEFESEAPHAHIDRIDSGEIVVAAAVEAALPAPEQPLAQV